MRSATAWVALVGSLAVAGVAAASPVLTLRKAGPGVGTVATLPNAVFCGEGCTSASRALPAGTEILAVAVPSPGSMLAGWSGGCSGHATACALTLAGSRTLKARFVTDSALPRCGAATTLFTQTPVPFADLQSVVPLGNLNPESGHVLPTKHVYLTATASVAIAPVSIPGAGWITFAHSDLVHAGDEVIEDWEIHLAPCREVRAIFLHVQKLAPEIRAALGDAGWCAPDSSVCFWNNLHVPVAAGQALGVAGVVGLPQVDLEAYDMRVRPVDFASNGRYRPEDRRFVCPAASYSDTASATDDRNLVRSRLGALLGSFDGSVRRSTPPLCGSIRQDLPRTAQGSWFRAGEPSGLLEDLQLALAHDNVRPEIPVISLGVSLDGVSPGAAPLPAANRLPAGSYSYVPRASGQVNRDFAAVTGAQRRVFCFESLAGSGAATTDAVLLLQMPAPNQLAVQRVTATDCDAARTAGLWNDGPSPPTLAPAVRFER